MADVTRITKRPEKEKEKEPTRKLIELDPGSKDSIFQLLELQQRK